MNGDPSYSSPSAFRQAVTDRLRSLENQGRWELSQLQRQLAYDRLLERLYVTNDGWVVKGATALLARDIGVRATRDIDLFRLERREFAEADLRTAAARDIGDWFRFELGAALALSDGARGIRMPVTALRRHRDLGGVSHRPGRRRPAHDGEARPGSASRRPGHARR